MSEEKKTQETTNSSIVFSKKRAILLLSVTAITAILIIAIVLIYHKVYYADRWYKNTTINGVDVSGQTLESSKKNLEKKYADYSLTISGRDKGQMQIDGNDIGYHFKILEAVLIKFLISSTKLYSFLPKKCLYNRLQYFLR